MSVIRQLRTDEYEEADLIWLQAFEHGNRSQLPSLLESRLEVANRSHRFGLWNGEGMQAVFELTNTALLYDPNLILPAGYISSIACKPASRGKGYGTAGLRHLLEHMRQAGQRIAFLTPFDFGFYHRLGWEWVSPSKCYKVPARILPESQETQFVRLAKAVDSTKIQDVLQFRFELPWNGP